MVTKYPLREFRVLFFNDGANNSTHAPGPRDGNLHIPSPWWIGSCMLPGVFRGISFVRSFASAALADDIVLWVILRALYEAVYAAF